MIPQITHIAAVAVLLALMLPVAVIDIRSMIIPDPINAAILVSGLAASVLLEVVDIRSAVAASVFAAITLGLVQWGFRALRGYDGLGWGDVKFVAAAATWTGLEGLAFALLIASVAGLLYALGSQLAAGGFDRRRRIPFGPFLALGATSVAGFQILSGMSTIELMDMWLISLVPHSA